jgi:hypothetical protein
VETLEKLARALEIPTYRLFPDDAHVKKPNIPSQDIPSRAVNTKQDRELQVFAKLLSQMNEKLWASARHGVKKGNTMIMGIYAGRISYVQLVRWQSGGKAAISLVGPRRNRSLGGLLNGITTKSLHSAIPRLRKPSV